MGSKPVPGNLTTCSIIDMNEPLLRSSSNAPFYTDTIYQVIAGSTADQGIDQG